MKNLLTLLIFIVPSITSGQISARLMQHPDVSDSQITFAFGDDIYIASKEGGTASRLTSPEGPEMYPRFSPDGEHIAFTGNYNGNNDVYVIPSRGGIPKRLTYHGAADIVQGWSADGKSVLFTSLRKSGKERFSQFYTISAEGGSPVKLSVPYGEFASFSENGEKLAYTDRSRVNRNWKRYRGGTAPDILIFDLNSYVTENITNNPANDELPMWIGDAVYYMSDNGPEKRNNLWKYDLYSKANTQLTEFKDFDITFPSNSSEDIIFEAGGKLYLYSIRTEQVKEINVEVITDQKSLIPVTKKVADNLQNATLSPDGSRVIAEARGELFNLPATEGFVGNISQSSGTAERYPSWSPDGERLAFWSDASGEYQLMIKDIQSNSPAKKITDFSSGYYYNIYWSPDSKKIVAVNQAMEILLIDAKTGSVTKVDEGKFMFEGGLRSFAVDWSPDSRYFVYSLSKENRVTSSIYLYNQQNKKVEKLTSGFYADNSPIFSHDGKNIYFTTNRTFNPVYSDVDNTFIYPNTTGVAVAPVNEEIPSILEYKNDTFSVKAAEAEEEQPSKKKSKNKEEKENPVAIKIDANGFEQRIEVLPIETGNIGSLDAVEDKLLFVRYPNAGSPSSMKSSLELYDIKKEETKTIASGVRNFMLSEDGKKVLVDASNKLAVIDVAPDQKMEKLVPVDDMVMTIIPKEEWKQIFNDAWRFERDFFYDPNMHGVNWQLMKERYGELVQQANSRNDVNLIIGDLIAELDASHTYIGGGDRETGERMNIGYLGADFIVENGAFRVQKIVEGAPWDVEDRSPLLKPGVDVSEGDYILAINGQPVNTSLPIHAALQGLGGKVVQLTINSKPTMDNAKKVLVKPMYSEARLRNLAWINNHRKQVEEATDGKIGYVFVPSTGVQGQNELVRQFYGQMEKEGFIIDERFNNGGQIPDRFVELLDRDPLAYWAVRDGKDWAWPPAGNFGPKVMLINGWAGSGGDAFPDFFRKRNIGPLIGTRTWGGLIGISGAPTLIDGGSVTVPTFRMYDPDGTWFKEGYGVEPDIKVVEDYEQLAKGNDVQLQAAIDEVMKRLNSQQKFQAPERPEYERRN